MATSQSANNGLIEWVFRHLDLVFMVLRIIKPTVVFKGQAFVTRFDDVTEVLERDGIFQVPYAEKMYKVTNGSNFFLGMQDTATYTWCIEYANCCAREDIGDIITPLSSSLAWRFLPQITERWMLSRELTYLFYRLISKYFGTPGGWNWIYRCGYQYVSFYPDDPALEKLL